MRRAANGVLERVAVPGNIGVERAIAAISRRPGVVFAEPNWKLSASDTSNDPYYTTSSRLWGMYGDDQPAASGPSGTTNQFGSQAEKAWAAGFTGSRDVYVGIVDEGVDFNHPDLAANMWLNPFDIAGDGVDNDGNGYVDDARGWDFYSNDNSVYDGSGDDHGTHVAGTVGGVGGNGVGVAGVSWNVTMIPTKFLGTDGGYTSGAIKAIDYLTDLRLRHGLNIVASNNSWGGGGYGAYSGTSMASPHVAGAVALIAVSRPGMSAADIRTAILSTARPTTSLAGRTATGGRLDVGAALSVAPPVDIAIAGGSVVEGNSGTTQLAFTVTLAAAATSTVTVNFATSNGTATAGSDYVATNGTLSFAPGETVKTILVDVIGDTGYEANETFTVMLSGASANARITAGSATGTITNDDPQPPPPATPSLSITSVAALESAGAFVFTVTLSAASTSKVTVRFATVNGMAKAGRNGDFTATSGTLTFNPGETSKSVPVAVRNDTLVEADETFFVDLSRVSGATISVGRGIGTIQNDDGVASARSAAFAVMVSQAEQDTGSRKRA
jgi:hypothetical protein